MLAVLSPAKKLDFSPATAHVIPTTPSLMKDAESLMRTSRGLSQTKIRELMKLSAELAKLNYDRYHSFELPFTPDNAMPAALAFNGDVYRGLDARSLSSGPRRWRSTRASAGRPPRAASAAAGSPRKSVAPSGCGLWPPW